MDAEEEPHVTEHLVVDVPVQLLHQLRTALARVHLQEHQCNLALRREVRSASPFRTTRQTKVLGHLSQGKNLLNSSQFTLPECLLTITLNVPPVAISNVLH